MTKRLLRKIKEQYDGTIKIGINISYNNPCVIKLYYKDVYISPVLYDAHTNESEMFYNLQEAIDTIDKMLYHREYKERA